MIRSMPGTAPAPPRPPGPLARPGQAVRTAGTGSGKRRDWGGAGSLVQADRIVGAVIKLGGARRLVIRNLLRALDCTTVLQAGGDTAYCEPPRPA